MPLQEAPRLGPPALHVDRAPDDGGVVGVEPVHVLGGQAVHVVAGLPQFVGHRLGDLGGGAVLARIRDEDVAHSSSSEGTTSTGRRLLWTHPFDTLPRAAETPVSPREPMTIAAHSCRFAASRTAIQPGPTARSESPVASKPACSASSTPSPVTFDDRSSPISSSSVAIPSTALLREARAGASAIHDSQKWNTMAGCGSKSSPAMAIARFAES